MKGTIEDIWGVFLDVVNQACQVSFDKNKIYIHHGALSAYEDAIAILEVEGYAKLIKRGKHKNTWLLSWDKLNAKS